MAWSGNKEERVCVNVYVEEFYQDYLEHGDLNKSVSEITAFIKEHHILDLAIVYMIYMPQEGGHGVIKTNRGMIKLWKIGEEELHQTVMENQAD